MSLWQCFCCLRDNHLINACQKHKILQMQYLVRKCDILKQHSHYFQNQHLTSGERSRRFGDLPLEYTTIIKNHLHFSRSSERVNPGLVVIPNSDHREATSTPQIHADDVLSTRSERGQPEVHVVLRPVHSVYQVSNDAWVFPVGRQDIDIRWVGHDVDRCDRLPLEEKISIPLRPT